MSGTLDDLVQYRLEKANAKTARFIDEIRVLLQGK